MASTPETADKPPQQATTPRRRCSRAEIGGDSRKKKALLPRGDRDLLWNGREQALLYTCSPVAALLLKVQSVAAPLNRVVAALLLKVQSVAAPLNRVVAALLLKVQYHIMLPYTHYYITQRSVRKGVCFAYLHRGRAGDVSPPWHLRICKFASITAPEHPSTRAPEHPGELRGV
jgi:hypothetical protein